MSSISSVYFDSKYPRFLNLKEFVFYVSVLSIYNILMLIWIIKPQIEGFLISFFILSSQFPKHSQHLKVPYTCLSVDVD